VSPPIENPVVAMATGLFISHNDRMTILEVIELLMLIIAVINLVIRFTKKK